MLKYFNYEIKTLTSQLTSIATTVEVNNVTNIPTLAASDWIILTLVRASDGQKEILRVNSVSGTTLTVARAQEGTTALQFEIGDLLVSFITAGMLDALASGSSGMDLQPTTGAITITSAHADAVVEVTGAVDLTGLASGFQCTLVNVSGSAVGLTGATLGNDLLANIAAGGVVNVASLTAGILVTGQMEA